eukprot:CAMPEP_0202861854 /NCGR_PEP_ID=MMETSP1391-20130828/3108_1 /ASSEMBLY_ACC=CAM_ASM_000867 /TAXON_ID=1034604 /ORGANISM="Chlamydomonas leiostraca, Strain SAG 11-49" /LENGTH=129 /DNA_ID=CAMNT_0049541295 /DNA_START=41 /DNA_END=430 /DNA_ORIENTATION=+
MAFAGGFIPLDIDQGMRLPDAIAKAQKAGHRMDGTDCAKPMQWAIDKGLKVDCFVVLTDNETLYARETPADALRRYRRVSGVPDAKLIVLATSVTSFSMADPGDPGMMDVAGLDSAVPRVVAEFVGGKL